MSQMSETLGNRLFEVMPEPSLGQLDAAYALGSQLEQNTGGNVTILFQEAVGGAGKSELISALKPIIAPYGVIAVPDEQVPSEFRKQHGITGTLIATGRIYGIGQEGDVVIPVKGFAPAEVVRILKDDVKDKNVLAEVSSYCLGSLRLARMMVENTRYLEPDKLKSQVLPKYLANIAALFLLDRIPAKHLKRGFSDYENVVKKISDEYLPEPLPRHVQAGITLALAEMRQEEFSALNKVFRNLAMDPKRNSGKFNPVEEVREQYRKGAHFLRLNDELERTIQEMEHVLYLEKPSECTFPLHTFQETYGIYRDLGTANVSGYEGVYREPRIYMVTQVPDDKTEQRMFYDILMAFVDRPLRWRMRKTALAILKSGSDPEDRNSSFYIQGDSQFFEIDSTGREHHRFFNLPYIEMEEDLNSAVTVESERLFYLSGDHSKVPVDPSMIISLVLESVFQQLGYPYIVQYINKRYAYVPADREIRRIK